jgi:hypothetical protein
MSEICCGMGSRYCKMLVAIRAAREAGFLQSGLQPHRHCSGFASEGCFIK